MCIIVRLSQTASGYLKIARSSVFHLIFLVKWQRIYIYKVFSLQQTNKSCCFLLVPFSIYTVYNIIIYINICIVQIYYCENRAVVGEKENIIKGCGLKIFTKAHSLLFPTFMYC
jgi:hypothetical protein